MRRRWRNAAAVQGRGMALAPDRGRVTVPEKARGGGLTKRTPASRALAAEKKEPGRVMAPGPVAVQAAAHQKIKRTQSR